MGQHLGKAEFSAVSKDSTTVSEQVSPDPPESQDEVFGVGGADLNQNNGCSCKDPAPDSAPQHDLTDPRPHLVRLFSRDAPGREDNTFKERPSESDELQTIPEEARPEAEQ